MVTSDVRSVSQGLTSGTHLRSSKMLKRVYEINDLEKGIKWE
jgi:hypothetical protein